MRYVSAGSKQTSRRSRAGLKCAAVAVLLSVGGALLAQPATAQLVSVLAGLLERSRDDAIARGVNPIPEEIRDALSGFVPEEILENVRWQVEGESSFIGRGLFAISSAYAVTLDNVIIFAGAAEASEPGLWAHEIYHVMQFDEWGIDGFLSRYIADSRSIENEAKEFRYQWWKATEWQAAP